jgi:probable rRNA maturation factor
MGVRVRIAASDQAAGALAATPVPGVRLRAAVRAAFRAESVREGEVSLTLLGDDEIAALNAQYLRHEGPTDVISFALYEPPEPVLGDVYVGVGQAVREARARRLPLEQELVRLAVHGVLHVLGHDHPAGDERVRSPMWQLQERIVAEVEEKA